MSQDKAHDSAGFESRIVNPTNALALGGVVLLLTAVALVLAGLAHDLSSVYSELLLLPFAGVGVVIAHREPRNPIGWIMLATPAILTIGQEAGDYAVLTYRDGHHSLPLARVAVALAPGWIAILLLPLIVLVFPDGRIPTGRWRATVWVYGAACSAMLIATAITDFAAFTEGRPRIDSSGELVRLDHGAYVHVTAPLFLVYAVIWLSWVVLQVVRFRRSAGDRRAQLKWLMSGGAIAGVGILSSTLLSSSDSTVGKVLSNLGLAGIMALPVAIGVGILKYRLYDIDRLVSRTVSYVVLTGVLVGTFVGLVALSTDLLSFSSDVGVAASTLAAAALFNPLRVRVQRVVDRRFNRARYDAEATVAAFVARLRDAVDLDTVQSELLSAVTHAVEPSHATVWIRSATGPTGIGGAP